MATTEAPAAPAAASPTARATRRPDPAIVTDECGVFVSASAAPGGDGKEATPFQTFAEAAAAKPARVFACAGTYTETMQVSFSGGVEVYGGFTGCTATSWAWSASMQAQITTVAGVPGVVLDGGANKLENVSVTAPSAPTTMPGGSSIALLVNGGSLDMTNGALTAGDAQDGAAGATLAADSTLDGMHGRQRRRHVQRRQRRTPARWARRTRARQAAARPRATAATAGTRRAIQRAAARTAARCPPRRRRHDRRQGRHRRGRERRCRSCDDGDHGAPGAAGNSGGGATGTGTLVEDRLPGRRRHGRRRTATPGQGGGGGGGAKGAMSVHLRLYDDRRPGSQRRRGRHRRLRRQRWAAAASAGGSSIALLVLDAQVTLTSVTLTAGKGGNGGAGGNGQNGGQGGGGMPEATVRAPLNELRRRRGWQGRQRRPRRRRAGRPLARHRLPGHDGADGRHVHDHHDERRHRAARAARTTRRRTWARARTASRATAGTSAAERGGCKLRPRAESACLAVRSASDLRL